ncbi:TetR/AcrR family transcriptional regulator [Richelia sinica FACHB-800]|nr:TetR/AcrR family transcriptional regulator [Richelia sinica FACHB-800]
MRRKMRTTEDEHSERVLSADKVEAILAGAMQEFLAHGFAAATMDRVTAAAGVSKTTVYSYFQDKEDLFTKLIEQLTEDGYEEVFNPHDPQFLQGEPQVVLRRIATNILNETTCENIFLNLVRVIIGESGRFPSLARIFIEKTDKRILELMTGYFAAHPELQLPDPEVAARMFLGTLVHYTILQYMLHGADIVPMEGDRLIDNLVHVLTKNQTTNAVSVNQFSGTRQKSSRRKRNAAGKFEKDYGNEPKQLRSIRLTDTAWEKLAEIAAKHNLTRSEMIEIFARNDAFVSEESNS